MSAVLGGLAGDAAADAATGPGAAAPDARPGAAASGRDGVPEVSVVVPTCCSRHALLMRCLQSLMSQSLPYDRYEILVVDDGRSHRTQLLIQALAAEVPTPVLRYLRPQGGQGPAAARNTGWRAARSDLIAFTDDDTVPFADWLARGTAALQQGSWAALGGRVVVPRGDGPPTDHERMTQGLAQTGFVTANAFVRRSALLQVQGFDQRFGRAWREDADLQFRLLDEAGPVGRCELAQVLHPVRPERWDVSLRQQKNAFFEALLYAKHPRRYRQGAGLPTPWVHYAIVALVLAALPLALLGIAGSALTSLAMAMALVLRLAAQRLRGTSHRPAHVLGMLASSVLIPFLSVYWRLRGALHFRVWFL